MKLKLASKVEIKTSPGKGMGVFAIDNILEGEIIEECHLITLNIPLLEPSEILSDYRFLYPISGEHVEHVIPSGYGCIYNHNDNNNAFWRDHPRYKLFQFIAKKNITIGEEICTYYGGEEYWSERNYIKKI
tara:strand:- start:285 stop:677 length:393 start_codon:yes stop_codon:yes gene_type:complete